MADNEQNMVLVAKLVDQVSDQLQTIQKNMVTTFAAAKKGYGGSASSAAAYGKSVKEVERSLHEFHERQAERAKEHKDSIDQLGEALKSMISGGTLSTVIEYAGQISAIGVAAGVAYAGIERMAEALEKLGDRAFALRHLSRASDMSADAFQKLSKTQQLLGVPQSSAEQGNMGFADWFSRWKQRQSSAIEQINPRDLRNVETYARGLDGMSTEQAERTVIGRILRSTNSVGYKARLLQKYNLPSELATSTYEEYAAKNKEAVAAIDEDTRKKAEEAHEQNERLNDQREKFDNKVTGRLSNLYGKLQGKRADVYERLNEEGAQSDFSRSLFGRLLLGNPKSATPNDRTNQGFSVFDDRKAQDTIEKGTTKGVLEGLHQFQTEQKARETEGNGGFAPGLKPQAFHPDAEQPSSYRFGSKDYPLVGGGVGAGRGAGTGRSIPSSGSAPSELPSGSLPPSSMAVLDAIAHAEVNRPFKRSGERGGYGETVSGQHFNPDDYGSMHPYESGRFRYFQGRYGPSSASGRYQETLTTYRENVRKYGIAGFSRDAQDKRAFLKASELYRRFGFWHGYQGATGDLTKDADKFGGDPEWWARVTAPAIKHEWTSVPGGLEPNDKTRNWISSAVSDWRAGHGTEAASRGDGHAHLGHHIRNHNLMKHAKQSGLVGHGTVRVAGDASVKIALEGFPRGTRTKASSDGIFKQVRLDRGRSMGLASEDA